MRRRGALLAAGLVAFLPALTSTAADSFDYAPFDSLFAAVVDSAGDVDYPRLVRERRDLLDRAIALLADTSPESSPVLFPDRDDALAYWINAYNVCVLKGVADHYPIAGVADVDPKGLGARALGLAVDKAGFFYGLRFDLGGREVHLYGLEHWTIRALGEPRIHFALNCASRGCPPLRREAYAPDRLDAQLDEQARRFLALPRGLRVESDGEGGRERIVLSPIFDWFRKDFVDWLERERGMAKPGILDYVRLYAPQPLPADARIEFADYDWSLNEAGGEEAQGSRR